MYSYFSLFKDTLYSLNNEKPTQTQADDFLLQYETEYGERHPNFQCCSYREAVSRARRASKFLLVYFHSPHHNETSRFCKYVLGSSMVVEYLNSSVLMWAGNVESSDGYRTAVSMDVTSYPSLVLVASTSATGTGIAERIMNGLSDLVNVSSPTEQELPTLLCRRITGAINNRQRILDVARREMEARNFERNLRSEQDLAFQASLEADRLKAKEVIESRKRADSEAEAEDLRQSIELSKTLAAESVLFEKRKRVEEVFSSRLIKTSSVGGLRQRRVGDPNPNIEAKCNKDTQDIVFRLPSGFRLNQSFRTDDSFGLLRDFLDVAFVDQGITIKNYSINTNFPKKTWTSQNTPNEKTLEEAGLINRSGGGVAVFVHDLDA